MIPRIPVLLSAGASIGLLVASCHSRDTSAGDAAASASASPTAASTSGLEKALQGKEDEVRPVYPADNSPPDPLALRFCKAINETQKERRIECCHTPRGFALTGECARTLSYAIRQKAATLDEADVDKCEQALASTYAGCDWVGSFTPPLPDSCMTVVRGLLPGGSVCRSSLECAGNLHCAGVGPTTLGKCAPRSPTGGACGGRVDTLAAYTLASPKLDETHPECDGFCMLRACATPPPDGTSCKIPAQCGPGHQCIGGKCVTRGPGKVGDACKEAPCAPDLACVAGKCEARRSNGQSCDSDLQCKSGCLKPDGGKTGTCGMKC